MRHFARAFFGLAILWGLATPGLAQSQKQPPKIEFVTRSEDDLLLLSLHLDSAILTQELEAYQTPNGILLPFGEVCHLLELAVTVVPATATGDGFVAKTDRIFHLDLAAHKATLAGKPLEFAANRIELHKNDIYIDARLLSSWFGLGFKIDTYTSSIRVSPTEPLPLQKRLERERLAAQSRARLGGYQSRGYPDKPNPYQLLGSPTIDQSLTLTSGNSDGGLVGDYVAQVQADVGHLGMSAFVELNSDSAVDKSTISFGQSDNRGDLLGFLHARQFSFGDIYMPSIPLLSESQLAKGFLISSFPVVQASQVDTTTLEGVLPPGWDVELYREAFLMDYRQAGSGARYEFKNLPLTVGANRYRLVFYGPHGERREEAHPFNITDTLAPVGKSWYQVAAQPHSNGNSQFSVQDEYGVQKNLSATAAVAGVEMPDGIHNDVSVGAKGFFGGTFGYASITDDPRTGAAEVVGADMLVKSCTVGLKQTFVNGLASQAVGPDVNPVKEQTELQIGNVAMPSWSKLSPTQFQILHEETTYGSQIWQVQNRSSYQVFGANLSNWMSWRSETGQPATGEGELMFNSWGHGQMLQAQVSYDWTRPYHLNQISVQRSVVLRDMQLLNVTVAHDISSQNSSLTATLTRNIGSYSYGLSASASTRQGISMCVNVSLGLVTDPHNHSLQSDALAQASRGAVLVRAFFDKDGDGKWKRGEPLIPGVAVFVNGSTYPVETGKDGTVLVKGLTQFVPSEIGVSLSSLSNPLWIPAVEGVRIVPRAGDVPILEFAIVATGEVSGTVYIQEPASKHEAGGIQLELVGAKNRVVQSQNTAYDGYFDFGRVPVGEYRIRVSPKQLEIMKATSSEPKVKIPVDGAYLDGVNVTITHILSVQ